jgi:hypothetical protein
MYAARLLAVAAPQVKPGHGCAATRMPSESRLRRFAPVKRVRR